LYKELQLEWRGRARFMAMLAFALLTLLLFSFAVGPEPTLLRRLAPGFVWLALLLASLLALAEGARVEAEQASVEGLVLLAVPGEVLFWSKALSQAGCMAALGLLVLPVAAALYGAELRLGLPAYLLVVLLGSLCISAPGTLYASLCAQARGRDVLLPLLLFPVLVPGVLAAVKATALVMQGDPMGEFFSWCAMLAAFAAVYWLLCSVLFGRLLQP
ncbi:MAG: transcriptional regulator, partial [Deltaproteobacteria bacterium]